MADIKTLPKGWEVKKLGEVCKLKNGFAFKSNRYESEGVPVIRISDIKDGVINTDKSIKVSESFEYKDFLINPEDILIAMSGATTGKFGIYKSNYKAYQNQRVGNFQILTKQLAKSFLFYQLHALKRQVEKDAYGGAQPNISSKKIEEMEILLPPLNKQQEIVSKIEELFSELDKGIAELKLAREQLKVYRQSVLKYAFEGRLTNDNVKDGELPKGWKSVKIQDIATVGTGATPLKSNKDYYHGGRIAWITSGALNSEYVSEPSAFVTEKALKETNLSVYPKNTLLLAMYGEGKTRGKCSELLIEACTNQAIAAIKFTDHDPAVKPFLKYFLIKNYNDIRMLSSGGVQPNLNLGIVKKTVLPFPPLKEQKIIIQEIENRLSVADKMEQSITESLQKAEALRQSILKKAFNGELVTDIKVVDVPKIKNEYFHQMQLVALVINGYKKKKIDHGEMTLAKNLYLLDSIYKIPTGFTYDRWHLGPYPPAIKKVVNNKQYFNRGDLYIEVKDEDKLLKVTNPYQEQISQAIGELSVIFSKYNGAERSHKTELLATVCKVIEDIKTTDLAPVRKSMAEWKIKLATSSFKNKAEKFNEAETEKCIAFIVERGWDKILLSSVKYE